MNLKNLSFKNSIILIVIIFASAVTICVCLNYRQEQILEAEEISRSVEAPTYKRDIQFEPTIPEFDGVDDRTIQE